MIGNRIGKLGEDIAGLYLKGKGFVILDKNYWKPYGEIDIICEKRGIIHFVEVKSVTCDLNNVSRERIRPEDNVHFHKLNRLGKVIEVYLIEKRVKDKEWCFDVCIVEIDENCRKSRVKMLENQILERGDS